MKREVIPSSEASPARATVATAGLPKGALVEIHAIATERV